jgi:hypothetical protein
MGDVMTPPYARAVLGFLELQPKAAKRGRPIAGDANRRRRDDHARAPGAGGVQAVAVRGARPSGRPPLAAMQRCRPQPWSVAGASAHPYARAVLDFLKLRPKADLGSFSKDRPKAAEATNSRRHHGTPVIIGVRGAAADFRDTSKERPKTA